MSYAEEGQMSADSDVKLSGSPVDADSSQEQQEIVTSTAGEEPVGTKASTPIPQESTVPAESVGRRRPQVTFMGNSYDITAVVAVVSGALIAFSCLTCNMGGYCLPIVPVVLGIVGLLSAEDSVDPSRTRLLSWLGVGGGGIVLLLMLLGIILYFGFIVLAVVLGAAAEGQ
jgi:hypothetical protein